MKGLVNVPGQPFSLRATASREHLTPYAEVLTAPFVGSDLMATPASSAFGTLERLVRLNELPPAALMSLFGIRVRRSDDLSSLMTFSEARQVALARALNLPDVPAEWNLSTWFPFKAPSALLTLGWSFRYCPDCLRAGYHTLLHQLPWVHACPWHERRLLTDCGPCGRRVCTTADWALGQNLNCECGKGPLDTNAALFALEAPPGARQYVKAYLKWAAEARATTQLVVPERAGDARPALASLVRLPRVLGRASGPQSTGPHARGAVPHVRSFFSTSTASPGDRNGLLQLEELRQDRPGFLMTPKRLVPTMTAVAARLALRLPSGSLTDGEMTLFLAGVGIEPPPTFAPAKRNFSPQLSMLPPTRVGERHFLNLTCMHPATYRAVPGLLDVVLEGRTAFDFYAQTSPAEFDLVMRACGSLLGRGYAEGLRSTIATQVPEIYNMPRDAPRLSLPWLLVGRVGSRVASIRITWTPLACAPKGEAAILNAEDEANRRRQRAPGRKAWGK